MGSAISAALIGIAVGMVVGALGAGGGILSVPVLTYLLAQPPHDATSESLIIVIVTALVSLPNKAKRGQVRWKEGALFGLLSTAGAVVGRIVNSHLDGDTLFLMFGVLLVAVAVVMYRNASRQRAGEVRAQAGAGAAAVVDPGARRRRGLPAVIVAATLTGMLTGLFGVGGGFAVVPVLMLVLRYSVRDASGTSLLVMIIAALASVGTGVAADTFHVDWAVTLLFTAGSALGGIVGGPLSQKARQSTLTYIFAALLVGVAVFTLVEVLA